MTKSCRYDAVRTVAGERPKTRGNVFTEQVIDLYLLLSTGFDWEYADLFMYIIFSQ